MLLFVPAGLPALQGGEPGQVRKEAAITIYCECRGKARHFHSEAFPLEARLAVAASTVMRTTAWLSSTSRTVVGTAARCPWRIAA